MYDARTPCIWDAYGYRIRWRSGRRIRRSSPRLQQFSFLWSRRCRWLSNVHFSFLMLRLGRSFSNRSQDQHFLPGGVEARLDQRLSSSYPTQQGKLLWFNKRLYDWLFCPFFDFINWVAILPARQSIEQIFKAFLADKDEGKGNDAMLFEMCEKLSIWFNRICRTDLLYNNVEQGKVGLVAV